ncbi:S-(hydroxymethyl)glutathione dehydrogenase [Verticillium dahliae VDG1]|nr:S-(hydroxymethyl)glutathione dehydrogenase [Verticillium dahliae VDG1]
MKVSAILAASVASLACRKDLFDQIDKLIDDIKKSKRQVGGPRPGGILDGLKACLRKPECRERMLKQAKDAQVAAAAGEMTKRQTDPFALDGVMACLEDLECAAELMANLDGPN